MVSGVRERIESLHRENELAFDISFFALGVLFDIFTLSRIDEWSGLAQQAIYLVVLGALLGADLRYREVPPAFSRALLARAWEYRQMAIHFLFGSLLSTYAIFYIKSSSIFTSAVFLALLSAVLVANELQAFRRLGHVVKYSVYSLCVASFLAYFVPVLAGTVGPVTFSLSMALTLGLLLGQLPLLRKRGVAEGLLRKMVMLPAIGVVALFSGLYALRMIPPVPLSIQQIGIYHGVEKVDQGYALVHEKPDWKFWDEGDQVFLARPGDRIFCFARIFSPSRFKDQVVMHWLRRDEKGRWQSWDRIPIQVVGGRDKGFRGFTVKNNFEPGVWRVQVETTDGREVGRIYLRVEIDSRADERVFRTDKG